MSWRERTADTSPAVQRSRARSVHQAEVIVAAAQELLLEEDGFTIAQLVDRAGIALQTFYRYFSGKDQLLIAVLEDIITGSAERYEKAGRSKADPVARLKFYLVSPFAETDANSTQARVIAREHFRLQPLYPAEVEEATAPFAQLVRGALVEATEAGLIKPISIERDAWMINLLVATVFHTLAFLPDRDRAPDLVEHLWKFCLAAVGADPAVYAVATRKTTAKKATAKKRASPAKTAVRKRSA